MAIGAAHSKSPILIAGDDDRGNAQNTGRIKAETVARKHNCRVVFPKFKNLSAHPTDFNDLHALEGLEAVSRQINASFQQTTLKALSIRDLLSLEIRPREMILNPILPEQGLTMIHAP